MSAMVKATATKTKVAAGRAKPKAESEASKRRRLNDMLDTLLIETKALAASAAATRERLAKALD